VNTSTRGCRAARRPVVQPFPMAALVTSDRRHWFDAPPAVLWDRMAAVGEYRRWWPWLRSFDADALRSGEVWACVVQPPLPYRLGFDLALDEVVPRQAVRATLSGDIVGTAALEISALEGGSELHLVSALAPGSRTLEAVSAIARPVARIGHDWVLATGIRQFRARAL